MFKLKLPPWLELVKFQSKSICDPETPAVDSKHAGIPPTLPPQECGQGYTDCPGIIEQEIQPHYQGAQHATNEYKCIIQELLIQKFGRLKITLKDRYNFLREEALKLTKTNSSGYSHRHRYRLKRADIIMFDIHNNEVHIQDRLYDINRTTNLWSKIENGT